MCDDELKHCPALATSVSHFVLVRVIEQQHPPRGPAPRLASNGKRCGTVLWIGTRGCARGIRLWHFQPEMHLELRVGRADMRTYPSSGSQLRVSETYQINTVLFGKGWEQIAGLWRVTMRAAPATISFARKIKPFSRCIDGLRVLA